MIVASIGLMAQGRGNVGTVAADTINGAETVNFSIGTFTGSYESLAITALCTEIGGTSDGTLTLYGSIDGTSYVYINGNGNVITTSPAASIADSTTKNKLTITDALVASWVVEGTPYKYYRVAGVGTASDSTLISIKYIYK